LGARSRNYEPSLSRVEFLLDRVSNLLLNISILLAILAGIAAMSGFPEVAWEILKWMGGAAVTGVVGKGAHYVFRGRIDEKYRDAIIEMLDGYRQGLTRQQIRDRVRQKVGDPGSFAIKNRQGRKQIIFEKRFIRVWNNMRVNEKKIKQLSGEGDGALYALAD
jgi:hypothetical protein